MSDEKTGNDRATELLADLVVALGEMRARGLKLPSEAQAALEVASAFLRDSGVIVNRAPRTRGGE